MTRSITYRSFRALLIFTGYPAAVLATTQNVFGEELKTISLYGWALVSFLIFLGGFTGLLRRLKKEYDDEDELRHPKLFISSNVFGAVSGGVIAFLAGFSLSMNTGLLGIFIIAGSYAGVVMVERTFDSLMAKVFPAPPRKHPARRAEDFDRELDNDSEEER